MPDAPAAVGAHVSRARSVPVHIPGLLLAACAFVWHAALLSKATNDNFFHMTLAKELLAGEWPVRDFFDSGWVLHYLLSASAQAVGGDRLLSEAVLVGLMWAVSTYLVFGLARTLTGSPTAAAVCAALLVIAGPRGYAYPKGIVYAAAAMLWWQYMDRPSLPRAIALGAWAGAAFYWRPDHGVYVAVGIVLAMLAAHGVSIRAVSRTLAAGATALALASPFLLYVQVVAGLPEYVQTGIVQGRAEHTTHATHELPLLRYWNQVVAVEPAASFAPTMTIRWTADSSEERRAALRARYALEPVSGAEPPLERVRLSAASIAELRALVNEPLVEDTAGIDRSTATIPPQAWPAWQRWRFEHPLLRVRILPSLQPHERASELLVALWFLLAAAALVTAPWLARHLPPPITGRRLAAFAAFVLVVDAGLLRTPYAARAVDAVALSSVLFGCLLVACWRAGASSHVLVRTLARGAAVAGALIVYACVAGAAEFGERAGWLAGEWRSARRARGAWEEVHGRLTASPPLAYYVDRPAGSSLRLAAYVRACVPPSERLMVLWFAPEIHYYADRRVAHRHLVFPPEWAGLEHEQRMSMDKIRRHSPPIVLARRSSIESQSRAAFPGVMAWVEQAYHVAGVVEGDGEEYLIFARRDRAPVRTMGAGGWPCFVGGPSVWERVGLTGD